MTSAERTFQRQLRDLGCVACLVSLQIRTECDIHHILSGGRRIGEMDVLGLCPRHHCGGENNEQCVSRHPWHKAFEARYGSERSLLAHSRRLVEAARAL